MSLRWPGPRLSHVAFLGHRPRQVYVDDLAFAGNCPEMVSDLRARLNADFKMTDMGQMSWFLGCEIVQDLDTGVTTLHQAKYIRDVVARFEGTELGMAGLPRGKASASLLLRRAAANPRS